MAGSATVSGQWATAPPGVEMPHGSPARYNCRLALTEGQNFLVSRWQCWASGLTVGPGRWGRTEGPQEDRVPGSTGPRSSVQPVSQQTGSS